MIYHDLPSNFIRRSKRSIIPRPDISTIDEPVGDVRLNKFGVGTAVMMAPFFLAGDIAASHASGAAIDGWSFPYQAAISIAGIFYACWGSGC